MKRIILGALMSAVFVVSGCTTQPGAAPVQGSIGLAEVGPIGSRVGGGQSGFRLGAGDAIGYDVHRNQLEQRPNQGRSGDANSDGQLDN